MHKSNVWLATALLKNRVHNKAGEDLGKIEDVVIDPHTGNIQYGILSFGGVLGLGNKFFAIPWNSLGISSSGDFIFDVDKETLKRAPGFDPKDWPNMTDPVWRQSIHDYYGPVATRPAPVIERHVVVERPVKVVEKRGMPLLGAILLLCLVMGAAWVTFLVSTRGWDQAKEDMRSTLSGAAYAARETSHDAALTTKVKSALALSKRIPSDQINVDSEGDVVTLRGEVQNKQVREMAEQIARDVPGVREVHNHLFAMNQSQ